MLVNHLSKENLYQSVRKKKVAGHHSRKVHNFTKFDQKKDFITEISLREHSSFNLCDIKLTQINIFSVEKSILNLVVLVPSWYYT
jgi:hypothetical protein